ncbi:MAG: hypothetical protein U9R38_00240 [Candidatus Margulisiibacteriota bacterium]|nr:hypothetical protein [Candidatus Margulisiibacteriota bacterium]
MNPPGAVNSVNQIRPVNPANPNQPAEEAYWCDPDNPDPITLASADPSYIAAQAVLNRQEQDDFVADVLGENTPVSAYNMRLFIKVTNSLVNDQTSYSLTQTTVNTALNDPRMKDMLRLKFYQLLSKSIIQPSAVAMPSEEATPIQNVASRLLSQDILDPKITRDFRAGRIRLTIKFLRKKGEIEGFQVFFQYGQYRQPIAEYRDGRITQMPGQDTVGQGAVKYLQRLLWGAGYLDRSGRGFIYGVFCKTTLEALYRYLSENNLLMNFNSNISLHILQQRLKEANRSYLKFKAAPDDSLNNRVLKYQAAKMALRRMSAVIQIAKRYANLPTERLSAKERAFVAESKKAILRFRRLAKALISKVFYGKDAFYKLDLSALGAKKKKWKKTAASKAKKKTEHFKSLIDTAVGILGNLRTWQKLVSGDRVLHNHIQSQIDFFKRRLRKVYITRFPNRPQHVDQLIQEIDQDIMSRIAGTSSDAQSDPAVARRQHAIAAEISKKMGNSPARGIVISILQSYIRQGKSLSKIRSLLRTFVLLSNQRPDLVKRVAMFYLRNQLRAAQGLPEISRMNEDLRTDLHNFTSWGDLNKYYRQKVMNLAFSFYSSVQAHNNLANSSLNKQPQARVKLIKEKDVSILMKMVMEQVKDLSKTDTRRVLQIVSELSESTTVANYELSEQLSTKLDRIATARTGYTAMNGGSSVVVTPRALHSLERKLTTTAALDGAVHYDQVPAHLRPKGATPLDTFFVSPFGVQTVPRDMHIKVRRRNNLAGVEHSFDPITFAKNERTAMIKLALCQYGQCSDREDVMLRERVTSRLTALDLRRTNVVFGESRFWILNPGTLALRGIEIKVLNRVADMIENDTGSSTVISGVLRKITSSGGEVRLTKQEKQELDKFLRYFNIDDYYPANAATTNARERSALQSAIKKLKRGMRLIYHKLGITQEAQDILAKLAGYLSAHPDMAIYDPRLSGNRKYYRVLVGYLKGRLGNTFNEPTFRKVYFKAMRILKQLHSHLFTLTQKNPPPETGYKGVGSFLWEHVKAIGHAGTEAIDAPSPSSFITVGLPNDMVFELNLLLYRGDLVPELGGLNTDIKTIEATIKALLASNQGNIEGAVANIKDVYSLNEAFIKELRKHFTDSKHKKDHVFKSFLQTYIQLIKNIKRMNENPTQYISQADTMLETVEVQLSQIDKRIAAEKGKTKLGVLKRVRLGLLTLSKKLRTIINTRNTIVPEYISLNKKKARREEIITTLSSDRFDADKFTRLSNVFYRLRNTPGVSDKILDWVSGIFSGDQGHVFRPDGTNTRLTPEEIIRAYFKDNPDASFSLQSLSLMPGEGIGAGRGKTITSALVKVALSKLLSTMPRESRLSLAKSLPALFGGHGVSNALLLGLPILSRLTGGADEATYGPITYDQLIRAINDPVTKLKLAFLNFLSLSSDDRPQMNMSSQVYMILANTAKGRELLAKVFARQNGRMKLDHVNQELIKALISHVKKEIIPILKRERDFKRMVLKSSNGKKPSNPFLVDLIKRKLKEKKIAFNLNSYISDPDKLDKLLASLPSGEFQVHDSFHSSNKPLSRFIEAILTITGEFNITAALQNPRDYAMTYFDPGQAIVGQALHYRTNPNDDPPRKIKVVRYGPKVERGAVRKAAGFPGIPVEQWSTRSRESLGIHGPRAVNGVINELRTDYRRFIADALKGGAGFSAHLIFFMGKQINMAFANTAGGLGDFLRAAAEGDKQQAYEAIKRIFKGLAHTTGAFAVFESMGFIFFSEVLNEIEAGNWGAAFGKLLAVSMLTIRGLMTTYKILRSGVKLGWIQIKSGAYGGYSILINRNYRGRAYEMYKMEMAQLAQEFTSPHVAGGKLGFKLIYFHLNPFAPIYRTGKFLAGQVRYLRGGLMAGVSRSPIQIRQGYSANIPGVKALLEPGTRQGRPSADKSTRWEKIVDFSTRYRVNETWRRITLFRKRWTRRAFDSFGSKYSAHSAMDKNTALKAQDIFYTTVADPKACIELAGKQITPREFRKIMSQAAAGNIPGQLKGAKITVTESRGGSTTTISFDAFFDFITTRSHLGSMWVNQGDFYDIKFSKGKRGPKQLGSLLLSGRDILELARIRAKNNFSEFNERVHEILHDSGQKFSAATMRQLYDTLEVPARVLQQAEPDFKKDLTVRNSKPFNVKAYIIALTRTGKTARRLLTERLQITRKGAAKNIKAPTGRQVLEILAKGMSMNPSGQPTVNAEVDAYIGQLFQSQVSDAVFQQALKLAVRRHLKGRFGRYKFATTSFIKTKLDAGRGMWVRRIFRRIFGRYSRYGSPKYRGWKDISKTLKTNKHLNARAEAYAAYYKLPVFKAREILAQRLYTEYLSRRTETLMGLLDTEVNRQAELPKKHKDRYLSDRAIADYHKNGVLKKGWFRRFYQKVSRRSRKTIRAKLGLLDASIEAWVSNTTNSVLDIEGVSSAHRVPLESLRGGTTLAHGSTLRPVRRGAKSAAIKALYKAGVKYIILPAGYENVASKVLISEASLQKTNDGRPRMAHMDGHGVVHIFTAAERLSHSGIEFKGSATALDTAVASKTSAFETLVNTLTEKGAIKFKVEKGVTLTADLMDQITRRANSMTGKQNGIAVRKTASGKVRVDIQTIETASTLAAELKQSPMVRARLAQQKYLEALRKTAKKLGIKGARKMSAEQLGKLMEKAMRQINKGLTLKEFIDKPAKLKKFIKSPEFKKFLRRNPKIAAKLAELKTTRLGSIARHQVTMQIVSGFLFWAVAEGSAHLLAKRFPLLNNPQARFSFIVVMMQTETAIFKSLTGLKGQKNWMALKATYRAFHTALAEAGKAAGAKVVARAAARGGYYALRATIAPKALAESLLGVGMGWFHGTSMLYRWLGLRANADGSGMHKEYINMGASIVTTALVPYLMKGALMRLSPALLAKLAPRAVEFTLLEGLALQKQLLALEAQGGATSIKELLAVKNAATASAEHAVAVGGPLNVLGAILWVLFADEMLYNLVLPAVMNEYDYGVKRAINEAGRGRFNLMKIDLAPLLKFWKGSSWSKFWTSFKVAVGNPIAHGLKRQGAQDLNDQFKIRFDHMKRLTALFLSLCLRFRAQLFSQKTAANQRGNNYYTSLEYNQFPAMHFKLSENEDPKIRKQEIKDIRKMIKMAYQIGELDSGELREWGGALAGTIKLIKKYFTKDGDIRSHAHLREFVLTGLNDYTESLTGVTSRTANANYWYDRATGSYHHVLALPGSNTKNDRTVYYHKLGRLLKAISGQANTLLGLRKAKRIQEIFAAFHSGTRVKATPADIQAGILNADGTLTDATLSRVMKAENAILLATFSKHIGTTNVKKAKAAQFAVAMKQLEIIRLKLSCMDHAKLAIALKALGLPPTLIMGKANAQRTLRLMGIAITPTSWDLTKMAKALQAFTMVQHSTNLSLTMTKLSKGEAVAGLDQFYTELMPNLPAKVATLFNKFKYETILASETATPQVKAKAIISLARAAKGGKLRTLSVEVRKALKVEITRILTGMSTTGEKLNAIKLVETYQLASLLPVVLKAKQNAGSEVVTAATDTITTLVWKDIKTTGNSETLAKLLTFIEKNSNSKDFLIKGEVDDAYALLNWVFQQIHGKFFKFRMSRADEARRALVKASQKKAWALFLRHNPKLAALRKRFLVIDGRRLEAMRRRHPDRHIITAKH